MCNENLDLVKLLGDCPKGTKLYSPMVGDVTLKTVDKTNRYPIACVSDVLKKNLSFTSEGLYFFQEDIGSRGECMLFPSKDNRDWSTFIFTMYKDGDFLANNDGRAFIFRGKFDNNGYPMAYGGVDTTDRFIKSRDMAAWSSAPFRKATPEEVACMMNKMGEAGYIWDANEKKLKRDLPIDTLVAVCNKYNKSIFIHDLIIRRYAGSSRCYINEGGSRCGNDSTMVCGYIIPLDNLVVDVDGTVNLEKVTNYGTYSYNV